MAKAQKEDLVIPKEIGHKEKRKRMSWRECKAKSLAKSKKDELEKIRDNTNNETSTSNEEGLVIVTKVFEPLDSMLQAFEARYRPNQSMEQVVREYLDPALEKKET